MWLSLWMGTDGGRPAAVYLEFVVIAPVSWL